MESCSVDNLRMENKGSDVYKCASGSHKQFALLGM